MNTHASAMQVKMTKKQHVEHQQGEREQVHEKAEVKEHDRKTQITKGEEMSPRRASDHDTTTPKRSRPTHPATTEQAKLEQSQETVA